MIFKLKQFSIQQSPDVFKVGTDAVVLGALLQNQGPRILEIGTGTGIIALMLAQRFQQAHITAIDINAQAVALAKNNFKNSPFAKRLEALEADANSFQAEVFDSIISNPPYFTDIKNTQSKDFLARQQACLSYQQLLSNAKRLLKPEGNFSLILPYLDTENMIVWAEKLGFFMQEIHHIQGLANGPIKRAVLVFSNTKKPIMQHQLCLQSAPRVYSDDYLRLTQDFHCFE